MRNNYTWTQTAFSVHCWLIVWWCAHKTTTMRSRQLPPKLEAPSEWHRLLVTNIQQVVPWWQTSIDWLGMDGIRTYVRGNSTALVGHFPWSMHTLSPTSHCVSGRRWPGVCVCKCCILLCCHFFFLLCSGEQQNHSLLSQCLSSFCVCISMLFRFLRHRRRCPDVKRLLRGGTGLVSPRAEEWPPRWPHPPESSACVRVWTSQSDWTGPPFIDARSSWGTLWHWLGPVHSIRLDWTELGSYWLDD